MPIYFQKWALTILFAAFLTTTTMGQSITLAPRAAMPEAVANNAVCSAMDLGRVYSFAGIDTSKVFTGIHLRSFWYDLASDTWSPLPDLPDTLGKVAAGASVIGDQAIIIGGYHVFQGGSELSSTRVHRLDLQTNTYLPDGASPGYGIDDHVQVVYKDSLLYIITGWSDNTNVPNVSFYDPAMDVWQTATPVPDNNNYKVFGASGAILGDTVYYFGGATTGFNFPATLQFVKGYIDPNDPTQITWSNSLTPGVYRGYRMASVNLYDRIYWIGGSETTYNYDGIAYNGSGGVAPANRILSYQPSTGMWEEFAGTLPMDLRGAGIVNDRQLILCGGMVDNQQVTDETWAVTLEFPTSITEHPEQPAFSVFPNPARHAFSVTPLAGFAPQRFTLTDLQGRVVKQGTVEHSQAISVEDLPAGQYWLQLRAKEHTASKLVVVGE